MESEYRTRVQRKQEQEQEEKQRLMERRCCLLRWMMAGMLFLVLAVAFYFDFSYYGFDREYVENRLLDDTMWNAVTTQIYRWLEKIQNI